MKHRPIRTVIARTAVLSLCAVISVVQTSMTWAQSPDSEAEEPATQLVDVPSGPLNQTIIAISNTYGIDVLVPNALVRGLGAPPVRGSYSAGEALQAALVGSGIVAQQTADGAYVLIKAATDATNEQGLAASAPEPSNVEEVIVYGAAKRETTLQYSDVSMTVFQERDLDNVRLRDFRRLDDLAPNVQFNESGQLSSVFVSIRGIESNPFIVNRAAIYIDGAPFRELDNAVMNRLRSIEVLRGPQSTLYGANSTAGLILVNTLEPGYDFEGNVRATTAFYDGDAAYTVDGFFAGPLVDDSLAGSLAFKVSQEDSFFPNEASSIGERGEIDELFLQGRLVWEPNEELTVKASAIVLDVDAPGIFDEEYLPKDRAAYDASYGMFNNGASIGRFEILQESPKDSQHREYIGSLTATYRLPVGTIDAALSYADEDEDSRGNDLDFTALPTAAGAAIFEQEIFNAELRYTSPESASFEYIVGISYYREEETVLVGTLVGTGTLDDFAFAPPQTNNSEDVAIFGSATLGLGIEGLSATAGLRFDHARRETDQTAGTLNFGPLGNVIFQDLNFSETFEEFLPRLALTYRQGSFLTLYASAAKGYIPGGFNLTVAQEAVADDLISFDSEEIWSYEIGAKTSFANGKGYLNGAIFLIDGDNWQEIQVITNEQGQVLSSSFIASDSSIENVGLELELKYKLTDALTLNASFGYVDAEYTRLMPNSVEDLSGNQVKLVPEYDANIALRYEHHSGFFARAEVSAIGETALDERNRFIRDPVEVFNFQAGFTRGRWTVRGFLENATNERFESGSAFDNFAFGFDGNSYASYDRPRVLGVELEMGFGTRR
ncbi:MAG: TonB-dependent receptor [Pseudomonadota bacterium]